MKNIIEVGYKCICFRWNSEITTILQTEKVISKFKLTSKNMEIINVSSKGQIVIPENIRKKLRIKTGSKLVLFEKGGGMLLKKEESVARYLEEEDTKEILGWMAIAEQSLKKVWNNSKDEKVWRKYL